MAVWVVQFLFLLILACTSGDVEEQKEMEDAPAI
jgi:hypothetical protein